MLAALAAVTLAVQINQRDLSVQAQVGVTDGTTTEGPDFSLATLWALLCFRRQFGSHQVVRIRYLACAQCLDSDQVESVHSLRVLPFQPRSNDYKTSQGSEKTTLCLESLRSIGVSLLVKLMEARTISERFGCFHAKDLFFIREFAPAGECAFPPTQSPVPHCRPAFRASGSIVHNTLLLINGLNLVIRNRSLVPKSLPVFDQESGHRSVGLVNAFNLEVPKNVAFILNHEQVTFFKHRLFPSGRGGAECLGIVPAPCALRPLSSLARSLSCRGGFGTKRRIFEPRSRCAPSRQLSQPNPGRCNCRCIPMRLRPLLQPYDPKYRPCAAAVSTAKFNH